MRSRTRTVALSLAIIAGLVFGSPAAAASSSVADMRADLDGRPIKLVDVGNWFCHDFDFPQIHCFTSATRLEAAVSVMRSSAGDRTTLAAAYGPNDYVTIYSEPSYGGSYAHLSTNYDQLWVIGWNDRISSFKVRNNAQGRFYSNWFAGGTVYSFCCNSTVPWMTSTYDNTFSSVYRS